MIRFDDVVCCQMEDVKSVLVASERLFSGVSDPSEMLKQTRVVTEVSALHICIIYTYIYIYLFIYAMQQNYVKLETFF